MTENFEESIKAELGRIEQLDIAEQPAAFNQLRDALEHALNQEEPAVSAEPLSDGGS